MPRISSKKKEKIQEQALFFLFTSFPKQLFTVEIAKELARDEEYVKKLLLELEKNMAVVKIDKNEEGIKYGRRLRWRLSNSAYEIYASRQKGNPEIKEKLGESLAL